MTKAASGSELNIATVGSVAALSGVDVAFIDAGNDDLRVYAFEFYMGRGPYRA